MGELVDYSHELRSSHSSPPSSREAMSLVAGSRETPYPPPMIHPPWLSGRPSGTPDTNGGKDFCGKKNTKIWPKLQHFFTNPGFPPKKRGFHFPEIRDLFSGPRSVRDDAIIWPGKNISFIIFSSSQWILTHHDLNSVDFFFPIENYRLLKSHPKINSPITKL